MGGIASGSSGIESRYPPRAKHPRKPSARRNELYHVAPLERSPVTVERIPSNNKLMAVCILGQEVVGVDVQPKHCCHYSSSRLVLHGRRPTTGKTQPVEDSNENESLK